jgi:hypothetical protein
MPVGPIRDTADSPGGSESRLQVDRYDSDSKADDGAEAPPTSLISNCIVATRQHSLNCLQSHNRKVHSCNLIEAGPRTPHPRHLAE